MGRWNILCDFDGTIAIEDITDSLLERFAHPDWQVLERDWRAGRIGSAECMAGQVALLDASREQIDRHLAEMRIDPAFPMFVEAVHAAGCTLRVVSDGIDYAIRSILARYRLDDLPLLANRLVQAGPRSWRLETPFSDPQCRVGNGHCKCASAVREHKRHHRVLLIGDGASDFCAAGEADYVFAKHRLLEHCRHAGIAHVPIVGFADALGLLPALLAGRLHSPGRVLAPEMATH
ncbi:MAG TPA: MtnX-like HAD-IB family phosphatase [Rhodanobacteraceae bacterium]|nr:MtnX-like HAD-IB family phosphatase [Rhodanobacteraceae bacterium]